MDFAANIMGFHGAFLHVAAKISQTKIQLDISSPACISCDHRFARKFANEMRKKRVRVSCDLFAARQYARPEAGVDETCRNVRRKTMSLAETNEWHLLPRKICTKVLLSYHFNFARSPETAEVSLSTSKVYDFLIALDKSRQRRQVCVNNALKNS